MNSKTSAANFGLNDIKVCVSTLYTNLIAQSIFLCQLICVCLLMLYLVLSDFVMKTFTFTVFLTRLFECVLLCY
jgi:hypothetical protein